MKKAKEKVEEALASGSAANLEQLKEELKKAGGAQALGVDDTVPKVQELKQKYLKLQAVVQIMRMQYSSC